jgi:hypothetical protein
MRTLLLLALSASLLDAQTTWNVNATGGGSFTTIQAAVQAASNGDIIRVFPTATYDWTLTLNKGLTILGATPQTSVTGQLNVTGLSTNQTVVIGNFTASGSLQVTNTAGPVIVLRTSLSSGTTALLANTAMRLSLDNCSCNGLGGMSLTNCRVTATSSFFSAMVRSQGVTASDSHVELSTCSVTGSPGVNTPSYSTAPGEGIGLTRSTLILAHSTVSGGTGPTYLPGYSILMDAASVVTRDVSTSLNYLVVGAGSLASAERGWISGNLAAPGGTSTLLFQGPAGAFGVLAVSLPAVPQQLPVGLLWLDSSAATTLAVGAMSIFGRVPVPVSALPGTAVVAQGLLLYNGGLQLSVPLVDAVR